LVVRGDILLPEVLVLGRESPPGIARSQDVVVIDDPEPPERQIATELDVQVRLILGDRVLLKAEGIDARLDGTVNLRLSDLDDITAQGEIKVVQGSYAAYGVNLRITRGNLFYAGVPVDAPTLDILALRTVGEVRAGVQITGTPRAPVVSLYSEPTMPDTDILAYIVLGHPFGTDGEQAGPLMLAAGSLLTQGESAVLQDRMRRQLGLDVLAIEAGNGAVAESRITIGKYLNPDLYISFGQSLFTNSSEVRMRYSLTEHLQLESAVGVESSVDLFYNIEFR
jgi:translocation and assembly module TamB